MRVVIDTNILVSACLGEGAAAQVIEACLLGRCLPVIGNALFGEYEDVLSRELLFQNCRLSPAERNELLDAFLARCQWGSVYFLWRPNLRDEGDNHLIELALATGAGVIVTRNLRDFANMNLFFPELRFLLPEQFLREI